MHAPAVPPHLFEHLETLIKKARSLGADAADGVYVESMGVSAAIRNGDLSTLERSENAELGLRVLVGKRQACVSSCDLHKDRLAGMVERAVAMAKLAPEDPYAGLADKTELAASIRDLDLFDGIEISAEKLVASAKEMEAVARADARITNVEESIAGWGLSGFAFVASNGFSGGYRGTSHSLSIETVAGAGTNMVRDYDYSTALHYENLRTPQDVAASASARTISRLHARKMPTGKIPVVFAPRVASGILRNFLGAISGAAIARKTSFLADCLGAAIFAPGVTLTDAPHMKRGLRSRPFDGEGLPTLERAIVEKGTLTTWLLNCSAARQLKMQSTGHASRGVGNVPGISASNFYMENGTVSPEQLIADIAEGFYVTETMGHGGDILTGDYSQGAAGFWIEKGQIAFPVHEMTIAGNLKPMFLNLTPANDLTHRYGIDAPTLRVEGMTVAGA